LSLTGILKFADDLPSHKWPGFFWKIIGRIWAAHWAFLLGQHEIGLDILGLFGLQEFLQNRLEIQMGIFKYTKEAFPQKMSLLTHRVEGWGVKKGWLAGLGLATR